MKAAYINRTGPPNVIRLGNLDVPTVRGSDVLVKVQATSLNPIDLQIRAGTFQLELDFPYVIGSDLAGVVAEVGCNVKQFKAGDLVWGCVRYIEPQTGTFAEYALVAEQFLYLRPAHVPARHAAACALVGLTAHVALFDRARVKPNDIVFVHGGSGGVGGAVVQLSKIAGATVITTGRNDYKLSVATNLGADYTINYTSEKISKVVKKIAPDGIDVWIETLPMPDLELAVSSLARGGRIVVISGRNHTASFPIGNFYLKYCSLYGFQLTLTDPDTRRKCANDLSTWMDEQRFQANIGKLLPLDQAIVAHELLESSTLHGEGELTGKIVLEP